MRIVDAFWEKRNLNVVCKEIIIEDHDTVDTLISMNALIQTTDYLILKIPVGRFDLCERLSRLDFTFIECSINFRINFKDAVLSPLEQRLNAAISYSEMNNQDIDELFSQIREGIFTSDRIILDPHFSDSQASTRYINWISDELQKNTQVYKIIYKDNAIGFFTFKAINDGLFYPFLAGLYKNYSKSGLGFTTLRKPIEEALKRNGKAISTYVSSNNLAVVRAHIQQGYSIHEMHYVFVRHNN